MRFVIRRFCGHKYGLALICPVRVLRGVCVARACAGFETPDLVECSLYLVASRDIEIVAARNKLRRRVVSQSLTQKCRLVGDTCCQVEFWRT